MKPDLSIVRYRSYWKYVIQRFSGGSYTLQAIERCGTEELDGEKPRRFVCLAIFPTEAHADDAMQLVIKCNPDGQMDQALPFWIEVEDEEAAEWHRGNPIIDIARVRELEQETEEAG